MPGGTPKTLGFFARVWGSCSCVWRFPPWECEVFATIAATEYRASEARKARGSGGEGPATVHLSAGQDELSPRPLRQQLLLCPRRDKSSPIHQTEGKAQIDGVATTRRREECMPVGAGNCLGMDFSNIWITTIQCQRSDSIDTNSYLQEIAGQDFTTKDFCTWAGAVLAVIALRECEPYTSQIQVKKNIAHAIVTAAAPLGNTLTICYKC
jgi:hypothetical protein